MVVYRRSNQATTLKSSPLKRVRTVPGVHRLRPDYRHQCFWLVRMRRASSSARLRTTLICVGGLVWVTFRMKKKCFDDTTSFLDRTVVLTNPTEKEACYRPLQ